MISATMTIESRNRIVELAEQIGVALELPMDSTVAVQTKGFG
jgi:hypothetical protein